MCVGAWGSSSGYFGTCRWNTLCANSWMQGHLLVRRRPFTLVGLVFKQGLSLEAELSLTKDLWLRDCSTAEELSQ